MYQLIASGPRWILTFVRKLIFWKCIEITFFNFRLILCRNIGFRERNIVFLSRNMITVHILSHWYYLFDVMYFNLKIYRTTLKGVIYILFQNEALHQNHFNIDLIFQDYVGEFIWIHVFCKDSCYFLDVMLHFILCSQEQIHFLVLKLMFFVMIGILFYFWNFFTIISAENTFILALFWVMFCTYLLAEITKSEYFLL